MGQYHQEFNERVSCIPFHGIGLSVDVYSPDVIDLTEQLHQNDLSFNYLEIFQASQIVLEEVRARLPAIFLEYHADGLWMTQPDWMTVYPCEDELKATNLHLRTLQCSWLNQECATKQMAGHSFGTYLPPLFTEDSARMTASNTLWAQRWFDREWQADTLCPPLFLLETPPLTYFCYGDLSYPEYFRILTDQCSCGLVLDIGHIWTVYRYAREWQGKSVEKFVEGFLSTFPLDRVVQIHIAGLDFHPAVPRQIKDADTHPNWIDAHDATIPPILFDMLDQVLSHPGLTNVKALAIEVDTKPTKCIVEEFARVRERYDEWELRHDMGKPSAIDSSRPFSFNHLQAGTTVPMHNVKLEGHYYSYAKMVTNQKNDASSLNEKDVSCLKGLNDYAEWYLPYEILVWGGDLTEMFPKTLMMLQSDGHRIENFVRYWIDRPRNYSEPYDYFLIKIYYFLEFVQEKFPSLGPLAVQEAEVIREGYRVGCGSEELEKLQDFE